MCNIKLSSLMWTLNCLQSYSCYLASRLPGFTSYWGVCLSSVTEVVLHKYDSVTVFLMFW